MPISRLFAQNLNLAIIRYSGKVTSEHILDHMTQLRKLITGHEQPNILLIIDADADTSGISGADLVKLAAFSPMLASSGKHVIVAPESLSFGISRMFASYSHGDKGDVAVVRTLAEACEKLKLDIMQVETIEKERMQY